MLLLITTALNLGSEPVRSRHSSSSGSYVCNYAKVNVDSTRGSYAIIRSGPGAQFNKIDRLHSGKDVYICDETEDWFKIFYGSNGPCSSKSGKGLDLDKTKHCQSGWVEKKWIEVISG